MIQRCPAYALSNEMSDLLNRMNRLAALAIQTHEPEILGIIKDTYKALERHWEKLREQNELLLVN